MDTTVLSYKESHEMEAPGSSSSQPKRGIIIFILNQRRWEYYKVTNPVLLVLKTVLSKHLTDFLLVKQI